MEPSNNDPRRSNFPYQGGQQARQAQPEGFGMPDSQNLPVSQGIYDARMASANQWPQGLVSSNSAFPGAHGAPGQGQLLAQQQQQLAMFNRLSGQAAIQQRQPVDMNHQYYASQMGAGGHAGADSSGVIAKHTDAHQQALEWQTFLEKVFMQKTDKDPWELNDLEDCQLKLESLMELHFKPDRDFIDYILEKKEKGFEDHAARAKMGDGHPEVKRQPPPREASDGDQDMQPMDLDEELGGGFGGAGARGQHGSRLGREFGRGDQEESKDEEKSYFARCKKIGRIGPKEVKLHKKSAYGEALYYGREELELEAISGIYSVRANTGVFSGRYYYEVQLKTNGLMQIGWCTLQTPFNSQNGVGDDSSSYAYDGYRLKKWNKDNLTYGDGWAVGDIIGTLIDFDRRVIQFWRNNKPLGRAFTGIKTGENRVYFPAISCARGQRVVFNFGRSQLAVANNKAYALIEEPDAEVNNHRTVAQNIIEYLKSYLVKFNDFQGLPVDKKLAVGSLMIEYLYPLIMDDYIMEEQLLQFLFEVTMIKKQVLRNLIFDLFILHLSPDQLKQFIQKLMKHLTKKLLNLEILGNQQGKPYKKDFDMTYFQLLMDLIEREEFLYAWLCSDNFFADLEAIFEMHLPGQSDYDDFFQPAFHEYLLGSSEHHERFLKNHSRAQSGLGFTQRYWIALTQVLMSRKKLVITTSDMKRAPFDTFRDFLHHIACRATKKAQNDIAHRPHQPGMNNNQMLTNIFVCFASQMDPILQSTQKSIYCFPYHCLFMRDGYDFDESLKRMDRIGGSFTHLEQELADHLQPFRGVPVSEEDSETFLFAKDLLLILINGILPEIEQYTLALDTMYMHHRRLMDLTAQGKIEKSSEICHEMHKILRTKLCRWRLTLQNAKTREMLLKYSLWLLQLVNHIDSECPDLIYILPDYLISIPFELLRMLKRESQLIVPSGMPICTAPTGPGANARLSLAAANAQALEQLGLINEGPDGMGGNLPHLKALNGGSQVEQTFYHEIVKFISRHFMDDRIANPDLKEHYLVRLNTLLQHNQFIKLFEQNQFAQQNLIPMLMRSFAKQINLRHASKNILRLAKGQGFREIVYEEVIEKTQSLFFLNKLRVQLLNVDNKDTKDFMNAFFNSLNDITTDLFTIFKEVKQDFSAQLLRRTQHHFYAVVDLLRICELCTTWCPELFLDVDQVHANRLMGYLMFTMSSVFVGEVREHISYFASKMFSNSVSLDQFLAPIVGIFAGLFNGIQRLKDTDGKKKGPARYENLEDLCERANAFNEQGLSQFRQLLKVIEDAAQGTYAKNEQEVLDRYAQMVVELEQAVRMKEARDLHEKRAGAEKAGKLREDSAPVVMGGQVINEDDFADENLCQICCFQSQDTEFVPCQHRTCKKCIQTHMLNSQKCPFCNAEIKSVRAAKESDNNKK